MTGEAACVPCVKGTCETHVTITQLTQDQARYILDTLRDSRPKSYSEHTSDEEKHYAFSYRIEKKLENGLKRLDQLNS